MKWALWKRKKPVVVGNSDHTGEIDRHSGTWIFVEAWASEQIKKLREKNDSANLSDVQTAVLRGKIKAMKELLDLPRERKGLLNN